ncbi:hypothetical protein [Vulcanococcus sp.]|uniref:hypothetical protein n=1 Tax=Vulcanococcus sp. TaxID=2856995 RepID=UPI003F69C127
MHSSFVSAMPRITIALNEKDHRALKLLSLRDKRRLSELIDEAIKIYLTSTGGYGLSISEANSEPTDRGQRPNG